MDRIVGTVVRGLRAPIIREGDDLEQIVVDAVLKASAKEGFAPRDRDVVCITEAVVARAQGNYANIDHIASDVRRKSGGGTIGVVFPILSRNRFAVCLRGMARSADKIVLLLSYPGDEVGNCLVDIDSVEEKGINPYTDVITLKEFEELFGKSRHPVTGMDYLNFYKDLIEMEKAEAEIVLANNPKVILDYTDVVLACDIHSKERTKRRLKEAGAGLVLGLDDILTEPVNGSGFNRKYGLLGSNKATDDIIKLFPNDCSMFVNNIKKKLFVATGKEIEVMVYGDGAFKDPGSGIWELADPVVSPCYTLGLEGIPNEIKLKYLADNEFGHLSGDELRKAISDCIRNKDQDLRGSVLSEGTTPRRITDLIGSLCDLTSGSGDKGTPIVYIQGYFDSYII